MGAAGEPRKRRTEHEHPEEVCAAAAEGALLERLAVLDEEEHVEDEVQTCPSVEWRTSSAQYTAASRHFTCRKASLSSTMCSCAAS